MEPDRKRNRSQRPGKGGGARRLIAGLRITRQDEALLDVVRPFLPEADSEGELAYRLWRRGLELTVGEAVSLGVALPPGSTEELIVGLVAQRLLLCVPLLRRTGKLTLLGIEAASSLPAASSAADVSIPGSVTDSIDGAAAAAIVGLGGSDFL